MKSLQKNHVNAISWHAVLTSVILASSAGAATWTVDDDGADFPGADFSDIQSAIDAASDADEILIYPGTYTSADPFAVARLDGKYVLLTGVGTANEVIIDGEATRRCMACTNDAFAYVTNLGMNNGFAVEYDANGNGNIDLQERTGGSITSYGATVVLNECLLQNGQAPDGGGISMAGNAYLEMYDSTISNCTSDGAGGAIYSLSDDAYLFGCTFTTNSADYGGALMLYSGSVIMEYCDLVDNSASSNSGGGIYCSSGDYTINQCTFSNNSAYLSGGGIYCRSCHPSITDCLISENSGGWTGGGGLRFSDNSNATLTGCTISNNSIASSNLSSGGGIRCDDSSPVITNCTISGNKGRRGGGIAFIENCNPTLSGCLISGNTTEYSLALGLGGGVYCAQSNPTLIDCTISENTATGSDGGGIYFVISDAVLEQCLITGNSANSFGGGLRLSSSAATFVDCSISGNDAGDPAWGDAVHANGDSLVSFAGASTSEGIVCDVLPFLSNSILFFAAEATCDVTGSVTPAAAAAMAFDLDNVETSASLLVSGTLNRQGGLGITNDSGSLDAVTLGDIIPLIQAETPAGAFASTVFPSFPEGLGAQLVELPGSSGDGRGATTIALEVIEVQEANFDDPLAGGLDEPPLDIVEFDPDGDGTEAIAVLFGGSPGSVAAFTVNDNGSAPTAIGGLSAAVGNGPIDIDAADLDGDGLDDLLVANADDATVSMLITTDAGDGTYFFTVTTLAVPGSGHTPTCVAAIDWDSGGDAVVGVDFANDALTDGCQVLLDLVASPTAGPLLSIPKFDIDGLGTLVPDPPTAVDGGNSADWGFVGATRYGRIHRATQASGTLQVLAELGGNRGLTIEARDLDENGGDGLLDIMVASDEAESIYLLPGDATEPDGFGDLIPLLVSEPVQDVVALDADDDGDTDLVVAAPLGTNTLFLLRNDDPAGGPLRALAGREWSQQNMNTGLDPNSLASGTLDPKDEEDDWVVCIAGAGPGLRGDSLGAMEQTNILDADTPCPEDVDGNGWVDVNDILAVISAWDTAGPEGDVDGNGTVNVDDLLAVISAFGNEC